MGLFRKFSRELGRIGRQTEKFARPALKFAVKRLPQLGGAALGTTFGGPLGGILAPSLLGALSRGKGNKLKGALQGGLTGAAYTAWAPTFAEWAGAAPGSFAHKVSGLSSPSLLNQVGISSAPDVGGGIGLWGNAGQQGLVGQLADKLQGRSPSLENGQNFLGDLLGSGAPVGLLESLMNSLSKSGADNNKNDEEERGDIFLEAPQVHQGSVMPLEMMSHKSPIKSPKSSTNQGPSALELLINLLSGKEADNKNLSFKPNQKQSSEHKDEHKKETGSRTVSNTHDSHENPKKYKKGGYIHGYSGGQTDDRPTQIPEGSYVMNATRVSLLGDGNSNNGAAKLKKMEDNFFRSGITRDTGGGRNIKALVSDGEYIIRKPVVDALGRGNNRRGAKVLDQFGKNISKQKGVKGIVQPKSKPLHYYLGGR